MLQNANDQFFESVLFQSIGETPEVRSFQVITGGCINNAIKLSTDNGPYFLKWNEKVDSDFFDKEAMGLHMLKEAGALKVPEVFNTGFADGKNYILMEFLEKQAPASAFWEDFGRSLAELHSYKGEKYGLDQSNFIGALPQKNEYRENWIDFFIDNRLEVQLGLAIYNGYIDTNYAKKFRILYPQLPGLLTDESPSLLHGDLWSGNFIIGPDGKAAVMDPAVYYGNREIEMAFTQLFGGYDNIFYASYFEAAPVEPGFHERADIYNLYPLMVHVNLFGTSYLSGVDRILRRYC